MKDGDLRILFRHKFPSFQWSSIETAGTATGVPDCEYCTSTGTQGWIEFKVTHGFHVKLSPLQVAWLTRRCRYGGNAWIAVRRIPTAKMYEGVDELWLMRGDQAANLLAYGLKGIPKDQIQMWCDGPSNWDWNQVQKALHLKPPGV